jgi:general stress protein 26
MSVPDPPRPLSDLVAEGATVMFMTMIGEEHSSRPLTIAGIDDDRLSFLVDRSASWVGAVRSGVAFIHLTVADDRHNTYLSLNGQASLSDDRGEIDRLWSAPAGAYFDGKDDPSVTVLRVDVDGGEYWSSPSGRIGAALSMLRVAVTRDHGNAGDHGPVEA